MTGRGPTPEEAAQSLREMTYLRQRVIETPPPRWLYFLIVGLLPVAGAVQDLWPKYSLGYTWFMVAAIIAYLYLPRVARIGTQLGYRVMPGQSALSALVGRRYAVLLAGLVVFGVSQYLVWQLRPACPHTIVAGAVALVLAATVRWTYPGRTTPAAARDVD